MKLSRKYLLAEMAGPFLLGLGSFTLVVLLHRFSRLADMVIARGVPVRLVGRLLAGESVTIDLAGVKTLLSLFLNNSIGPLFKHFDRQQLDRLLSFENPSESQRLTIDLVLKNAEAYHRDPATKKAVDETLARILEEMD